MARGRGGTPVAASAAGVQVVEAPAAFSTAQAKKAQHPKHRAPKAAVDGNARGDGPGVGRKRKRTPEWDREYQQIWKTVNELGAEQFRGKDKKAYDARKILERGGRAPKQVKIPYTILQGIRKKAKKREECRAAMEAEAGVVTGKVVGSARRASGQTNRGRNGGGGGRGGDRGVGGSSRGRESSSVGPAPSMGLMKSGVLHISRNTAPAGLRKRMSDQGRGGGSSKGKRGSRP